jgi:hypothetical protein
METKYSCFAIICRQNKHKLLFIIIIVIKKVINY